MKIEAMINKEPYRNKIINKYFPLNLEKNVLMGMLVYLCRPLLWGSPLLLDMPSLKGRPALFDRPAVKGRPAVKDNMVDCIFLVLLKSYG